MEIKSRQLLPKSYRSPIWAAVFGITISILGFFMAQGWKQGFADSSFQDAAKHYAQSIQKEIDSHIEQIYDVANLYEASDLVRRRDFNSFVGRGLRTNTGTVNIQWLPHVPFPLYRNFETETRHFEFPSFRITEVDKEGNLIPVLKRANYFPIYYTESYIDDFNNIIGLDPTTDHIIERIKLQRYDRKQNLITQIYKKNSSMPIGFVEAYLPVYRSSNDTSATDKKLLGLIRATFDIRTILANTANLVGKRTEHINSFIFDNPTDEKGFATLSSEAEENITYDRLTKSKHSFFLVKFGDRKWSMVLTPRNMSYFSKRGEYIPYIILFIGVTITLLLTLYLLFVMRKQDIEFSKSTEKSLSIDIDSDIEDEIQEEGMWAIDKSGITTFANSYMVELLEYSGVDELTNNYIYSLMDRASKRKCIEAIKKQKMGVHEEFKINLVTKNQKKVAVLINLTPFFDEQGRYDGALANIARIGGNDTQSKTSFDQAKLNAITEFANEMTAILDENGAFQYISASIEKVAGYASAEIVGKNSFDFVHPEDAEEIVKITQGLSKSTGTQVSLPEFRLIHKDGTTLFFEGTATNMTDIPGVQGIVINAKDVTEKHQFKILNEAHNKAMEAISEDVALQDVLAIITKAVEGIITKSYAAVFTYDAAQNSVSLSTAPNLSSSFCRAMQSLKINDHHGCTTTAMYEDAVNITADILTHPHHLSWREILSKAELRSCWSYPVKSTKGDKLGAFTCYFRTPRTPEKFDLDILQLAANYTGQILERKQSEEALRDSEIKWRSLIAHMPDYVALLDLKGHIIFANRVGHGFALEQVIGTNLLEYIDADHRDGFRETMEKVLETGKPQTFILPLPTPRGNLWWSNRIGLMKKAGEPIGFVTIGTDITDTKQNEQSLLKLSSAVDQSASSVMITNTKDIIEYVNNRFTEITGYSNEEVIGKTTDIFKSGSTSPAEEFQLQDLIKSGKSWHGEIESTRKNGEKYWELVSVSPIRDDSGELTHFVTVSEDLTELKNTQVEIERLAYYDTLTGLENRKLFRERLEQTIEKCKQGEHNIAILYLDLDQFKRINDTLGHDAGDSLLKSAAKLLRSTVSPDDFVARFGGDEFAVLLTNIPNTAAADQMARKIIEAFSKPFKIADQEIITTTSIGITVAPADTLDPTTLIKNADLAMYRAKELGRNNYQFFTSEMNVEALGRLFLENELRQAIEKNQFIMHYQPIVNMNTQTIAGFEALVRWKHKTRGMISPDQFIYVAEETGLIVPLGELIINMACKRINKIHEQGIAKPKVAVNLSVRQFQDPNLPKIIETALKESGLPAKFLQLEITESMLLTDIDETIALLHTLKEFGVSISIDDFGTGYSSLSYLKRLPIDVIKVDKSFVHDIPEDSNDMAITAAVIAMAHKLQLQVVAEGVETHEQLNFLKSNNCDFIQGFLYSRPVAEDSLNELIKNGVKPA